MSRYPENFQGLPEERRAGRHTPKEQAIASDGLGWIRKLPEVIAAMIVNGRSEYGLEITDRDIQEAMALINEAINDLFHEEGHRLMDVVGWESQQDLSGMLLRIFRDSLRPFPQNPNTYQPSELGE